MGVVRYLCITILLSCLAVSSAYVNSTCNWNGRVIDAAGLDANHCYCISGYGGDKCDEPLTCGPAILTAGPSTTASTYPKLDKLVNTMNFTNNTLTASIFGPVVANRSYTDVKFLGANGADAAKCALMGTEDSFWSLSSDEDSCGDRLSVSMHWGHHGACGFKLQTASDKVPNDVWQFRSTILVTYVDLLGQIGEEDATLMVERRSSVAFEMYVNFPKFVNVSIQEVIVYSEVNVSIAITMLNYDPDTMILSIVISAVLKWPNQIRATADNKPEIQVPDYLEDGIIASSLAVSSADCPPTEFSLCLQKIGIEVKLNETESCSYDGAYNLTATVSTCRYENGDNSGQTFADTCMEKLLVYGFWIEGSDMCGAVSDEPQVAGSLKSYADDTFDSEKEADDFLIGSRGYFELDIDSENDVNATFIDLWVVPTADFSGSDETHVLDPVDSRIYFVKDFIVQNTDAAGNSNTNLQQVETAPNSGVFVYPSIVDLKLSTDEDWDNDLVLQFNATTQTKVYAPRFHFKFDAFVFKPSVGEYRVYDIQAKVKIVYRGNEYLNGKRELKTRVVDFVWKATGATFTAGKTVGVGAVEAPTVAVTGPSSSSNLLAIVLPIAGVALVAIVGAIVVAVIIIKKKNTNRYTAFSN